MKLFLEKFTLEVFHRRYFRVNLGTFPDYLFCRTTLCYCSWGRIEKVREPDSFSYVFFEILYRKCSLKKVVLRSFTKLTRKHMCQSLLFNEVAGLKPATLLKKRLCYRCFLVNFAKFLRTPFSQNTSAWLLLWLLKVSLYFYNTSVLLY